MLYQSRRGRNRSKRLPLAPCSVKAYGVAFLGLFSGYVITICDDILIFCTRASHSSSVSLNIKSGGKRSIFRFTAWSLPVPSPVGLYLAHVSTEAESVKAKFMVSRKRLLVIEAEDFRFFGHYG